MILQESKSEPVSSMMKQEVIETRGWIPNPGIKILEENLLQSSSLIQSMKPWLRIFSTPSSYHPILASAVTQNGAKSSLLKILPLFRHGILLYISILKEIHAII